MGPLWGKVSVLGREMHVGLQGTYLQMVILWKVLINGSLKRCVQNGYLYLRTYVYQGLHFNVELVMIQ
jgi:hypothetical protein